MPENATAIFDADNPVAVEVASAGGNSGDFLLAARVKETSPDIPLDKTHPGDIELPEVTMIVQPVGPGSPVTGTCTTDSVLGSGYDAIKTVVCSFTNVPVNTYSVEVTVEGGYYDGYAEDVFVVFDPSLGFTTGGGWFYWPESENENTGYQGNKTNFGYTMKYNKQGTNIQGSLLLIRHMANGYIYRVKSNALYGLALGESIDVDGIFGWASFSGKSTYLEPGWPENVGNHEFVLYVEDRNKPGIGVDRVWIEVHDKDGYVIDIMSMPRDAYNNTEYLQGGNIVVPHKSQ